MHREGSTIVLAPTDVAAHLACRHLTQLRRAIVEGRLHVAMPPDPRLEALRHRGDRHEAAYVESLRAQGLAIVDLRAAAGAAATLAAMRDGIDVIVQAPLAGGHLAGRADILRRVPAPSAIGAFSYEPADTKLARETRAGTLLQLCAYAALLTDLQGREPARLHVVTPIRTESYWTAECAAYFRLVRRSLHGSVALEPPPSTYPDPVPYCDVCALWAHCDRRRRTDDHLSLTADMRTLHARELQRQGIATVAGLASTAGALPAPPRRGALPAFARLAHQARLQVKARGQGRPPFDVLEPEAGRGLCRLPEPSPGDVFLDFEGDPFVADGGLEYLTGWAVRDDGGAWAYTGRWALTRPEERSACEAFLDFVQERWERYPDLTIYHFGVYEPAALKRLVARHVTRAETLDRLLRGQRFVDLHAVVREALRIGVERYGLKELEPLTGFRRDLDLRDAAAARLDVELALELGDVDDIDEALRARVGADNRGDCLSTAALRDWLESVRAGCSRPIPRPVRADAAPSEHVSERERRIDELSATLLAGVPADPLARSEVEQARWLLAGMLGYFRREEKCAWWEHFRVCDLPPEDLLDEREAVGGLELVGELPRTGKERVPTHRYRFPAQETALDQGDRLRAVGDAENKSFGVVAALDLGGGTIDIRKTQRTADVHPPAVFREQVISAEALEASLLALGRHVATAGLEGEHPFRAACDLLRRRPPRRRMTTPGVLRRPGEDLVEAAIRLTGELDGGVLPIQGPPGSGKTYTGARVIRALAAGHRIGVTAVSHKVIDNLLAEVGRAAGAAGVAVRLVHKNDDAPAPAGIEPADSNEEALGALAPGTVVGGTAWLWAREAAEATLDYLFVDEAGQMALAQVLAAARAARNVVLLGDPQQLEQPRRGAHPEGTDVAALVHVLGAETATLADDQGLFLDRTWRLHPKLCAFTSEVYYEGRLEPVPGLDRQAIDGPTPFAGAGPYLVEVVHEGNQATAPEEVEAVARIVRSLLTPGVTWRPADGVPRALEPDGILVVAPYNAQVAALRRRLEALRVHRVGTVDRFQGQEAAVAIYSCTSSSPEDAPRGLEFLYDPHRFNVATSRARAVAIVVASPRVFTAECRTAAHVRMVNGLCRFRELAAAAALP
ncbi:MAG: TM0106 family RecB-like putative nuclease [Candidatus Rokuibacteriota bacterium]